MAIVTNKYENIIFDLGGVLLNIDTSQAVKAFNDFGVKNFDTLVYPSLQKKLTDSYEKGQISTAAFRNEIKRQSKNSIDDISIDKVWNSMLLDFPKTRLDLLLRLKQTHRTFLLSNTNEIHIVSFNAYLQKNYKIADLSGCFEKTYLSYKLGMSKPDPEIFKLVLSENKLHPNETLFIDDSIQHIEGAKKLGIQTYWLDVKKESILDLFP